MINVDEYIGKLELLKRWIYLRAIQTVCVYNQLRIFEETGILGYRIDFVPYSFEEFYKMEAKKLEEFKNFGMIIPMGIERHPDGSPVMFIKHKDQFLTYCEKEGIDLGPIPVQEREKMYKKWEDENISNQNQQ